MNYQISSDNMEVTQSMRELVRLKLETLERHWLSIPEASRSMRIVLNTAPKDTFLVKIDAILNGADLFVQEEGFEFETTLVDAVGALDRMVTRNKEKKEGKVHKEWEKQREQKSVSEEDLEE